MAEPQGVVKVLRTARYETICPGCGVYIQMGQWVQLSLGKRARHYNCLEPQDVPPKEEQQTLLPGRRVVSIDFSWTPEQIAHWTTVLGHPPTDKELRDLILRKLEGRGV